jgi:choline dehydrogenase-like flavoprotein
MPFEIKGKLLDNTSATLKPLSNYTVKAFDEDPFPGSIDDDFLGSAVTLDDGSFKITFNPSDYRKTLEFWDSNDPPQVYLQIYDTKGALLHETNVNNNPFVEYSDSSNDAQCEAVVIGSGFGGTITSLSLVNKFAYDAIKNPTEAKKKVIVLERGQWWVSHELPASPSSHELSGKPTPKQSIREFLENNNMPYRTWPYPDNLNGLGQLLNNIRNSNNRLGLLDYRISNRVHTLTASGVGGGSLIYTNVTEEPNKDVINAWKDNLDIGIDYSNLSPYFKMARGFIGVNKIATNSSLGDVKLPRAKAFHDIAKKMKDELPSGTITNEATFDSTTESKFEEDIYAANLSITDIPSRKDEISLFNKLYQHYNIPTPSPTDIYSYVSNAVTGNPIMQENLSLFLRKYFDEQNACQRQGRCAIGCIPGARHTNNKKIFDYLNNNAKKEYFEVRALADVYDIEPLNGGGGGSTYKYKIHYIDFGVRNKKDISDNWVDGTKSYNLDANLFEYVEEGKEKSIECNILIIAAGAIGSTEILLKSMNTTRNTGQKLKLSKRLGKGYSTNGDLLGIVTPTKSNIYATRGPMVTSAIRFKEGSNFIYTIEDTGIPKIFSGISQVLSQASIFRKILVATGSEKINQTIDIITSNLSGISIGIDSPLIVSESDLNKTLILAGMGTDTSDGEIKLRDNWKNDSNRNMKYWNVLDVDFDMNKLAPLYEKILNSMKRIASEIGEKGSSSFTTPLWDPDPSKIKDNLTAVVHNLGGCSIGKDKDHGVVNNFGKVFRDDGTTLTDTYVDFYVVDGAIIPTSLGVNPSLTISALAFRIAENIVGISNLPVEKVSIGPEDLYFSR